MSGQLLLWGSIVLAGMAVTAGLGWFVGSTKDRELEGFLLGLLLGPLGILVVAVMPASTAHMARVHARLTAAASRGLRPCPFCAEMIQPAAIVCRYCTREVPRADDVADQAAWDALAPPES